MPFDSITKGIKEGAYMGKTPVPLLHTDIKVVIRSGLAMVTTERKFRNSGSAPMEATLTFPVPPRAVVHGLESVIDGRTLHGEVQAKEKARETYETGMDNGKVSILHEQVASGIHMLSLGQVRAGGEVSVRVVWTMPLTAGRESTGTLLIPTTIGDIYGHVPMQDSDAPIYADHVHPATLFVDADCTVTFDGKLIGQEGLSVLLNAPLVLRAKNVTNAALVGKTRNGKTVTMEFNPSNRVSQTITGHILMDRSGSMNSPAYHKTPDVTKHDSALSGLNLAYEEIRQGDKIGFWEFDSSPNHVASVTGPQDFRKGLKKFRTPGDTTEIGRAIAYVLNNTSEGDILVLTDGQTFNVDIGEASLSGRRIHAVYIGEETLQGGVEDLVRRTGGESREAAERCDDTIISALGAFRRAKLPAAKMSTKGNPSVVYGNSGDMEITMTWKKAVAGNEVVEPISDAIAAYAAYIALPHVSDASAWAALNGIVTDATSLVLVDNAGEKTEGLSVTQKVALSRPRTMMRSIGASVGAMKGMAFAASASSYAPAALLSASGSNAPTLASLSRPSFKCLADLDFDFDDTSAAAPIVYGGSTSPLLFDNTAITIEELGRLVAWDSEGARILTEGWSIISIHARALLAKLLTDSIRKEALSEGTSPELLLLARAAATVQGNRSAMRFARKVLPNG